MHTQQSERSIEILQRYLRLMYAFLVKIQHAALRARIQHPKHHQRLQDFVQVILNLRAISNFLTHLRQPKAVVKWQQEYIATAYKVLCITVYRLVRRQLYTHLFAPEFLFFVKLGYIRLSPLQAVRAAVFGLNFLLATQRFHSSGCTLAGFISE